MTTPKLPSAEDVFTRMMTKQTEAGAIELLQAELEAVLEAAERAIYLKACTIGIIHLYADGQADDAREQLMAEIRALKVQP